MRMLAYILPLLGLLIAVSLLVPRDTVTQTTEYNAGSGSEQTSNVVEGTSVLYLKDVNIPTKAGAQHTTQIRITPGKDDAITAVALDLRFDPALTVIDSIDASNSPFSILLLAPTVDSNTGHAELAVGIPAQQSPKPITTDTLIANVTYTARKAVAGAPITFTKNSVAAAAGKSGNVVSERIPEASDAENVRK